jgi:hypothetical protein
LCGLVVFCLSSFRSITHEIIKVPEYIITEKIVTVNVSTETVREIPVEIEKIVNGKLKEFSSLGELTDWVNEHLAVLLSTSINGTAFALDCDDYACRLQQEAYQDGYAISVQLVENGMLDGKNVSNYTEFHMGNLAVIGDEIYFIEPQPEYFRVVYVCNRD